MVTAKVDSDNVLRVAGILRHSLFGLLERDFMLYHDIDFALFHNNLQDNIALRVAAWQSADMREPSPNLPLRSDIQQMMHVGPDCSNAPS